MDWFLWNEYRAEYYKVYNVIATMVYNIDNKNHIKKKVDNIKKQQTVGEIWHPTPIYFKIYSFYTKKKIKSKKEKFTLPTLCRRQREGMLSSVKSIVLLYQKSQQLVQIISTKCEIWNLFIDWIKINFSTLLKFKFKRRL